MRNWLAELEACESPKELLELGREMAAEIAKKQLRALVEPRNLRSRITNQRRELAQA